jgi:hypothetical protein
MGRFLCRLGLHSWRSVGATLFANRLYRCRRCKAGKENVWAGTIIYADATEWDRREARFK